MEPRNARDRPDDQLFNTQYRSQEMKKHKAGGQLIHLLHSLADLFIPTPAHFLLGSFQQSCNYWVKAICSYVSTTVYIYIIGTHLYC